LKIIIPILVLLLPITHFINYRQSNIIVLKRFIFLLIGYAIIKWLIYLEIFNTDFVRNIGMNILIIFEFIFIGWFYSQVIKNKRIQNRIKVFNRILLLASIINFIFLQGFDKLNSYTIILGSCIFIYYIFEYFKEIIEHVENKNLLQNPFFWISTGYLFFYTGLFVLMNFGEYFTFLKEFNSFRPIWDFFTNLITTILYTCLLVAFSFRFKLTNT
jgi:hypothetical protein